MARKILVLLESSTSGHLFVRAARGLGFTPVLLTASDGRYPNLSGEKLDAVLTDTSNIENIASTIARLQRDAPIAGILATAGVYAAAAAELSRRYRLPGGDPRAIEACQNKFIQRETLRSSGQICPQYELVTSVSEGLAASSAIGFPLIAKPAIGSGSTGVRLCGSKSELENHLGTLFRLAGPEGVLIEEFLEGPEFSIETIGDHVLGITRKHLGGLPYFVEVGHDFPAILPHQVAASINDTVLRALAALRLDFGPAHTELRLTNKGPAIIEVNPRMGGDMIPELVRLATGIDVVSEVIRLVTGHGIDLHVRSTRHASIRFLTPDSGGTVRWQANVDQVKRITDVSEVELYVGEGSQLRWRGDYRDRIGHVIVAGDTEHHVEVSLAAALTHLGYRIERAAV
ncbi:ATP-grasp domain-containing protein [Rhizobium sp. XQZ8]|uniref:ATP-grasp domain-containing protein n=1 Tax=Rhizobium populisoli TaxID=2859785 RepID=UPI001CA5C14A|nr:ATP-grasp domain-containing protein [Rhizobium populisoli]MBW6425755.1 ATP-grasp domain-containing protein [Rhizobium populisoli]